MPYNYLKERETGRYMEREDIIKAICAMVTRINDDDSLKRIYNLAFYLFRNKKVDI